MTEIKETAITWDHDTGEIWVSTRSRRIAAKLKRMGLKPLREAAPGDYVDFMANETFLGVSLRRRQPKPKKPLLGQKSPSFSALPSSVAETPKP